MRPRLHLALPLLAALACGGGGPSGPGPGPGPDDTIGPAGGTVSLGQNAIVRIPAGALATQVEIRITEAAVPAALAALGAFAPAYRFEPEGQAFAVPVEIEIFVPDAALGGRDPAELRLVTTGGPGGAEPLSGIRRNVVAGGVRLIGTTTHFSVVAPAEPPNADPTVNAGEDRSVVVGEEVEVEASTSDPDGDPVTVAWAFESRPAGSQASLSGASGPSTGFVPDVPGEYRVRATAADGRGGSASDVVVITAGEVGADAGPDQSVETGSTVALDGTGSKGQNLTYAWRFVSTPGATPAIQNANQANASFVPNAAGEYLVELTVSNASGSDRDTVRVIATDTNRAPTVELEAPEAVFLGATATIAADASDPDDDSLTFTWTLVARPDGSGAGLSPAGPSATLVPDSPGAYLVRVTVSDGEDTAQAEIVVLGNVEVAGTYEATFTLTDAQGCGDAPPDVMVTGELPITQPSPTRVVLDLPSLDPIFGNRPEGRLEGSFFLFSGTISIVGVDGTGNPVTISMNSTVRGTMDGTSLDLTFRGSIFTCQIQGTITGPRL